jgi:thioredoxin-related protein
MKKIIFLITIIAFNINLKAQEIKWISLNEALVLQKENPKKIMMDVYTNWCGPCKMLDKQTFRNKDVVAFVNENYYAVKFNAEGNETINYKEQTFSNPNYDKSKANRRNGSHEFTEALKIRGYPTIQFLSETGEFLLPLTGLYKPQQLEFYLKMFVDNKHIDIDSQEKFDTYYNAFKPVFKSK